MLNDEIMIDEIRAALGREPEIPHPEEIAVTARAGTVTLRGSVGSFRQRRAVVQVAKAVPGVAAVADELMIDPRDHWDDNEIRGAALQALITSPGAPDDRIEVRVANGWLTLSGRVRSQSDSNAAFEAVSQLPGVGGITNQITVITAGTDG